ncbi:agmatine deiminase family protein [Kiritimatiellaeota bacterium B1221]|nr:agmatine deiminase family protein [Kiritimatiellaeota bacterium B1221]
MMLRLPAEFEPQSSVWLTWLGNPNTWPDCREAAEKAYAVFASTVSHFQSVEMICAAAWQEVARFRLKDAGADFKEIIFHDWPVNDAWCRDHGPLFVKNESGKNEIVDFVYNAWGGKFSPWQDDDAVARRVSELRKVPAHRVPNVGEGGAIEVNARGQMITTESVWLNDNRNPGWTRADAEACFEKYLGVTETLWLKEGLIGDDTDGHIDTISRFVSDDTVVTSLCEDSDPNFRVLMENRERLNEKYGVVDLPHPEGLWKAGERLPATYANFLILNAAVLVPTYGQKRGDTQALGILGELFPGREVLGVPSEVLIREGGSLHCLSMQEAAE